MGDEGRGEERERGREGACEREKGRERGSMRRSRGKAIMMLYKHNLVKRKLANILE